MESTKVKMQCSDINEAKTFSSFNEAIDFNFDYLDGDYEYIELK